MSATLTSIYDALTHCDEHGSLCAFHAGNMLDRCPWCHSSWSVILRSDWHSCEKAATWPSRERARRVEIAVKMRREAAHELDRDVFRTIVGGGSTSHREDSCPRENVA